MNVSTWLNLNKDILQGRSPDEIALMARLCGEWDWDDICAAVPEFHMDQQTRTTFEIRKRWFVDREIKTAEQVHGKPDLDEKWLRVVSYENGWDD